MGLFSKKKPAGKKAKPDYEEMVRLFKMTNPNLTDEQAKKIYEDKFGPVEEPGSENP